MIDKHCIISNIKRKSINNKILANDIEHFVTEMIYAVGVYWPGENSRSRCIEALNDQLQELYEQTIIEQYNVLCDQRNNTHSQMSNGIFNLTVKFKQRNCVNTSQLDFEIHIKLQDNMENEDVI